MLKKTITYTDYDGNERTEDFYFNLSKAEVIEIQWSEAGGLDKFLQKIVDTQDLQKLIIAFKELLLKSYGEKSADGRRFMKSEEITKNFSETEAFSEFYMELATDATAAENFIKGVLPPIPQDNQPPTGGPRGRVIPAKTITEKTTTTGDFSQPATTGY